MDGKMKEWFDKIFYISLPDFCIDCRKPEIIIDREEIFSNNASYLVKNRITCEHLDHCYSLYLRMRNGDVK